MSDTEWAKKFEEVGLCDWSVRQAKAQREIGCGSFARAGQVAAEVAELADKLGHHPDIDIRYPDLVVVTAWTQSSGGLTGDDLVLAKRVDMLLDARER